MIASRSPAGGLRAATRALVVGGLAMLLSGTTAAAAPAGEGDRDFAFLELPRGPGARAVPKFKFLFGESVRWPSTYRWRYNHANAPASLAANRSQVIAQLQASFARWTDACGIQFQYEGETSAPPNRRINDPRFGEQPDFENVVGWQDLDGNTAGLTYAWFVPEGSERNLVDADVILDFGEVRSIGVLDATMVHEWGHALGLDHSDVAGTVMSGPPDTVYTGLANPTLDDVRGCRCLYGMPAGRFAGYDCGLPRVVDLGTAVVGERTPVQMLTLTNAGNATLAITGVSYDAALVTKDGGCAPSTTLAPGASCTFSVAGRPSAVRSYRVDLALQTPDGPYPLSVRFEGVAGSAGGAAPVRLVEYLHAGFGHYFVTHLPNEIDLLDDGTVAGWTRTGRFFDAWASPQPGTLPVCRFFSIAFAPKSSHFYTALENECENLLAGPTWTFEGKVFHIRVPEGAGVCPAGTQPVYRLYNAGQGGAPNHRFTIDPAVRAQMLAQDWVPEGLGLGVTMCSPLPG